MIPFEEFDRLFERIFHGSGQIMTPSCYGYDCAVGPGGIPAPERRLLIDAIHDEKNGLLKLVAEIPGVEKDGIDVSVQDDAVHIRASRGDVNYEGAVSLRTAVDFDSIKAVYRNGILEVSFPVESGPKGRKVRVE